MPKYWNPMPAIQHAIRMFMEEEPKDALRVLHSIQEDYYAFLEHDRMVDFADDLKEDAKAAAMPEENGLEPKPVTLTVTNHLHSAKAYPERHECETAVQELRNETGWDWTFISVEDETGDCWHHTPCILIGSARVYLHSR